MINRLSTKRTGLLVALAALMGAAMGAWLDRAVLAQQAGIKRTILLRGDDPGAATHEAVMGLAEIDAGATGGRHFHHGMEIGYVIDGSISIEQQGKPAATFKAGEAFRIDVAAAHEPKNTGKTPAKILAVYVVEKGKPLAEPAK